MSDAEFKGLTNPGPDTYGQDSQGPDASVIKKRYASSVALKMPLKGLDKSWRYEKKKGAEAGNYETL